MTMRNRGRYDAVLHVQQAARMYAVVALIYFVLITSQNTVSCLLYA